MKYSVIKDRLYSLQSVFFCCDKMSEALVGCGDILEFSPEGGFIDLKFGLEDDAIDFCPWCGEEMERVLGRLS